MVGLFQEEKDMNLEGRRGTKRLTVPAIPKTKVQTWVALE
jgi:hypothetical protein